MPKNCTIKLDNFFLSFSDSPYFKVIASYPKSIESRSVCAGYAVANLQNLNRSPKRTEFTNAFQLDAEKKTCKIGSIPYYHLNEVLNLKETVEDSNGIHVLQNCKIKTLNVSEVFATSAPELRYYFPGSDERLYEDSELTLLTQVNPFTFPLGINFINGQPTFKTLTDSDVQDAHAHLVQLLTENLV